MVSRDEQPLSTSGGVTITQVVESVLPFPASAEAAVMAEAIENCD